MRPPLLPASLLACVLVLSACTPTEPPAPATTSARPTQEASAEDKLQQQLSAHDNLNAVAWMQTSVEYTALATQTYRAAADHLATALKEKNWDALTPDERGNDMKRLQPAVIMDVDETVLDNSPYQARLIANGKEYNELSWDQWVAEKKAKAVPGVVDFARAAAAEGVTILYISNRAVHLKEATLANLREQGLPVADDSVFLGLGTLLPGCQQHGTEKGCRRKLAGQKYRVLMQFGDQIGDFVQIPANTRAGRQSRYDEYRDWFGERWWILPNPSYGSWEPALFNNDWQQSPQARSQAKRAALELAQ